MGLFIYASFNETGFDWNSHFLSNEDMSTRSVLHMSCSQQ